jgi:hypothetical protein
LGPTTWSYEELLIGQWHYTCKCGEEYNFTFNGDSTYQQYLCRKTFSDYAASAVLAGVSGRWEILDQSSSDYQKVVVRRPRGFEGGLLGTVPKVLNFLSPLRVGTVIKYLTRGCFIVCNAQEPMGITVIDRNKIKLVFAGARCGGDMVRRLPH